LLVHPWAISRYVDRGRDDGVALASLGRAEGFFIPSNRPKRVAAG